MRIYQNLICDGPMNTNSSNASNPQQAPHEIGSMVYTILTAEGDELIELVNRYIAEGWEPLGGIATSNDSPWFAQAMIRPRQTELNKSA